MSNRLKLNVRGILAFWDGLNEESENTGEGRGMRTA